MRGIVKEIDKLLKTYGEIRMLTKYKGTGDNNPNVLEIRHWVLEKEREFKEEDKKDAIV